MDNKRIILVGSPNVGKSVIFYQLTGQYATVSNYPGTTVEVLTAPSDVGGRKYEVIDTPGVHSLWPQSEDEEITLSIIKENPGSIILHIIDAKNLQRSLCLTFQLIEMRMPLILVLNLYDEAQDKGIKINTTLLENTLGVSVVPTVATVGEGMSALKQKISEAAAKSAVTDYVMYYPPEINRIRRVLSKYNLPAGFDLVLIGSEEKVIKGLSSDESLLKDVRKEKRKFARPPVNIIFETYYKNALEVVAGVLRQRTTKSGAMENLGYYLLRPFPGYIVVAAVLYLMYLFIGVFAAGTLVDFLEERVFNSLINPAITSVFDGLRITGFFREMFVGKYGMVTMAVTYAVAIILPIVGAFFIFFSLLEDSGYMPRLAALLDRFFRWIGLNGKAVLPMILGLGCGTMATLTTRILETKRERIIATFLLSLCIPCSAQLGIILGLLSAQSFGSFLIWFVTMITVFTVVGIAINRILPGATSQFLIEIPPLRLPMISNILLKIKQRMLWYLKEAVPLFILGTFILFMLDKTGFLEIVTGVMSPVIRGVLGLPEKTANVFLIGFLRRDYGAAGFYDLAEKGFLDRRQVVVGLVTMTLFVPCLAQFLVMLKERGKRVALTIFALVTLFAVIIGGILSRALSFFGF
ncbi:MAG: ferrous iron transport protein B [Elusimicrobiota bacterium]